MKPRRNIILPGEGRITEQPEDGIAVAQEVVYQEGDLLLSGEIKLDISLTSFNDSVTHHVGSSTDCQRNELQFPSKSVMRKCAHIAATMILLSIIVCLLIACFMLKGIRSKHLHGHPLRIKVTAFEQHQGGPAATTQISRGTENQRDHSPRDTAHLQNHDMKNIQDIQRAKD